MVKVDKYFTSLNVMNRYLKENLHVIPGLQYGGP